MASAFGVRTARRVDGWREVASCVCVCAPRAGGDEWHLKKVKKVGRRCRVSGQIRIRFCMNWDATFRVQKSNGIRNGSISSRAPPRVGRATDSSSSIIIGSLSQNKFPCESVFPLLDISGAQPAALHALGLDARRFENSIASTPSCAPSLSLSVTSESDSETVPSESENGSIRLPELRQLQSSDPQFRINPFARASLRCCAKGHQSCTCSAPRFGAG